MHIRTYVLNYIVSCVCVCVWVKAAWGERGVCEVNLCCDAIYMCDCRCHHRTSPLLRDFDNVIVVACALRNWRSCSACSVVLYIYIINQYFTPHFNYHPETRNNIRFFLTLYIAIQQLIIIYWSLKNYWGWLR